MGRPSTTLRVAPRSVPLTPEEIRTRLAFKSWHEFLTDPTHRLRFKRFKTVVGSDSPLLEREKNRQTGRSARVLCNALAALSRGIRIRIRANCILMERSLLHRLTSHAQTLGIPYRGLIARREKDPYDLEIFDHTFWGTE